MQANGERIKDKDFFVDGTRATYKHGLYFYADGILVRKSGIFFLVLICY